ncbi:MAG: phospholipase D-like domain-containing protein [Rhodothermales bacterium]|nr:phospholipase D-like domain-containing protein [Rhodothermales bacterium]
MPAIADAIELYMGPLELGGADDLEQAIVGFIDGAKKSLFVAVQELDSPAIAEAIIRARKRRVLVKLVLEADYLVSGSVAANPFEAGGAREINRTLHNAILRAAIRVNSDFNPHIFHQKFMVRDKQSVLTGSANFTTTDTSKNLNHLVIVHDRDVAKAYDLEFSEIQQGRFGAQSDIHGPKPLVKLLAGVRVKVLFAPEHAPEMEMMKQIAKARSRIDFAIFTFAQSSGIDDQLALVKERPGVVIRGALHRSQANQSWSSKDLLHAAGVELHLIPTPGRPGPMPSKLHHKLMVIDESIVIAGSFNYTGDANKLNDENLIILGDLECTDPEGVRKQRELARYALDEIDRMVATFGERVV